MFGRSMRVTIRPHKRVVPSYEVLLKSLPWSELGYGVWIGRWKYLVLGNARCNYISNHITKFTMQVCTPSKRHSNTNKPVRCFARFDSG